MPPLAGRRPAPARRCARLRPSDHEAALLSAAGLAVSFRVVMRRPVTILVGRGFYLPALVAALITLELWHRHGLAVAGIAAAIAGPALALALLAHECGHLLAARRVKGIVPRLIVMRQSSAIAVVEGRFEDAAGEALFAAGGLLATVAVELALVAAAATVPGDPVKLGLMGAAILNAVLLAVNVLPVAPTDGYVLFCALLWSRNGCRAAAERCAARWSWCLLAVLLSAALTLSLHDPKAGAAALLLTAVFTLQHGVALMRHGARAPVRPEAAAKPIQ
jgi:Zn-dependent protease